MNVVWELGTDVLFALEALSAGGFNLVAGFVWIKSTFSVVWPPLVRAILHYYCIPSRPLAWAYLYLTIVSSMQKELSRIPKLFSLTTYTIFYTRHTIFFSQGRCFLIGKGESFFIRQKFVFYLTKAWRPSLSGFWTAKCTYSPIMLEAGCYRAEIIQKRICNCTVQIS